MNKSQLFSKAHKIAKTVEGDYRARFAYGLTQAWKEFKGADKMIELKGTEKQVKWANDIRQKLLNDLETCEKSLETYKWNKEKAEKLLKESRENLESIDSSKYFIDNHREYRKFDTFGTGDIKEALNLNMRLVNHAFKAGYND